MVDVQGTADGVGNTSPNYTSRSPPYSPTSPSYLERPDSPSYTPPSDDPLGECNIGGDPNHTECCLGFFDHESEAYAHGWAWNLKLTRIQLQPDELIELRHFKRAGISQWLFDKIEPTAEVDPNSYNQHGGADKLTDSERRHLKLTTLGDIMELIAKKCHMSIPKTVTNKIGRSARRKAMVAWFMSPENKPPHSEHCSK